MLNLAWQNKFMWDGAIHHLDLQALAPLTHHAEMDSHLDSLILKLRHHPKYPSLFESVYGSSDISGERILKSLSAFMLTSSVLIPNMIKCSEGKSISPIRKKKGYHKFKQHCASVIRNHFSPITHLPTMDFPRCLTAGFRAI
ncbi:MAG: cytochrome-c peroxidase [Bacteroidetes bacterium]|nr:cytochrome-c peroxidase [Bacteroidota bacterium]